MGVIMLKLYMLLSMLDPVSGGIFYLRSQQEPLDTFTRAIVWQTCTGEDTGDYMVRAVSHELKTKHPYIIPLYCAVQLGR